GPELDEFLDSSLRHHEGNEADAANAPSPTIAAWIARTEAALTDLAAGQSEQAAIAELDTIRATLDAQAETGQAMFTELAAREELARTKARKVKQKDIAELKARLAERE